MSVKLQVLILEYSSSLFIVFKHVKILIKKEISTKKKKVSLLQRYFRGCKNLYLFELTHVFTQKALVLHT